MRELRGASVTVASASWGSFIILGMTVDRRKFLVGAVATTIVGGFETTIEGETHQMFGTIGKIIAVSGQRDTLIAILLKNAEEMPGCRSYIVAKDSTDVNAIWVTEVWDSKASHDASLSLPSVKQAIAAGKPLIASFEQAVVTEPIGGHGLAPAETR
jgi:quinol monooxygenase YgiN